MLRIVNNLGVFGVKKVKEIKRMGGRNCGVKYFEN